MSETIEEIEKELSNAIYKINFDGKETPGNIDTMRMNCDHIARQWSDRIQKASRSAIEVEVMADLERRIIALPWDMPPKFYLRLKFWDGQINGIVITTNTLIQLIDKAEQAQKGGEG